MRDLTAPGIFPKVTACSYLSGRFSRDTITLSAYLETLVRPVSHQGCTSGSVSRKDISDPK
jgi:hypothetical protein